MGNTSVSVTSMGEDISINKTKTLVTSKPYGSWQGDTGTELLSGSETHTEGEEELPEWYAGPVWKKYRS